MPLKALIRLWGNWRNTRKV